MWQELSGKKRTLFSKVRIKNLTIYLEIRDKLILMKYGGYARNFFTVKKTF